MIELQLTIRPFDFVFIFDFIEIKGIKRNARKNRIIIFFFHRTEYFMGNVSSERKERMGLKYVNKGIIMASLQCPKHNS